MMRSTHRRCAILILLLVCFSLCILRMWQPNPLGEGNRDPGLLEHDRQTQGTPGTGHYTVPGLGARKQAILKNGGTVLDVAIAMLETETMQANYYTYGDS